MVDALGNSDPNGAERGLTRRAMVNGAAWSIPAVAVAIALPRAAASTAVCAPGSRTFVVPSLDRNSAGRSFWTVPRGVTEVTFAVAGGVGAAGAGPYVFAGESPVGGVGALVTGVMPTTPGEVLEIIVGQGGSTYSTDPAQTGGQGYGNGGTSTLPRKPYMYSHGGGGGGGSAILRAGVPLVVAGGGGGGGALGYRGDAYNAYIPSNGGPGDGNSTRGVVAQLATPRSTEVGPAIGQTGGVGSGNRGGWAEGLTAIGRDGADGNFLFMYTPDKPDVAVMSGGGGGGYDGGGSGCVAWYYHVPSARPTTYEQAFFSSGGAGGRSYVSSEVSASIGRSSPVRWSPRDIRRPGTVLLTWEC